jgi:hypothetical protein
LQEVTMPPHERAASSLPTLPLAPWSDTKQTLHLFVQVLGKLRLALHPPLNHWWHAPLYVSVRGLTTRPIPTEAGLVELELDLVLHEFVARDDAGGEARLSLLGGTSVAEVHGAAMAALAARGLAPRVAAKPYDPARVGSDVAFGDDRRPRPYDPDAVHRFWRVLAWSSGVLTEFAGRFTGKSSPVHLFWHSLDLALNRFSGRPAVAAGVGSVDADAYSHEIFSVGFWAGDANVPQPAYYAYLHPEPAGLRDSRLEPAEARWRPSGDSSLAVLPYEHVRSARGPRAELLAFLESAYQASAGLAGWDVAGLTRGRRRSGA